MMWGLAFFCGVTTGLLAAVLHELHRISRQLDGLSFWVRQQAQQQALDDLRPPMITPEQWRQAQVEADLLPPRRRARENWGR